MANSTSIIIRPLGQLVAALSRYGQQLYQPPKDTIRGVEPDTWYSPLQPVKPIGPPGIEPRGFQYYAGQNLLWTPRADAEYSAADLKELARYPLARIAIENVKDELCKASWQIQPRPQLGESRKAATKRGLEDVNLLKLNKFFEMPDREHTWPEWLRPLLEDMLVIDAWSILIRKTFSGEVVELIGLRGDSIVRYIDENGFTPLPPEPAYAQLWWGIPLINLSTDQLVYKPRNIVPRNTIASQLYGMSPCEQLAPEIEIGIKRLAFISAYYSDGSVPGAMQVVPKGVPTEKIAEAMQWMNSELAGNLAKRRQWQLIQGWKDEGKDEQIIFPKEPLLADLFDEQHTRRIAFGFGISPQRLMRQMNRAAAQASQEAADIEGLLPYFSSLKALMDFIIRRKMGFDAYEMVFDPLAEPDPSKQAETIKIYVSGGVLTPNEGRERLGEEARSEPEADMLGIVTGTGFVPLGGAGGLSTPAPTPPKSGEGVTDGIPDKGKGGAGASGGDEELDADGKPIVADGRGQPRKPASANKPNGGAAAKAQTENRPIGFATGTVLTESAPPEHGVLTIAAASGEHFIKAKPQPREVPVIHPGRLLPPSILARHKMERDLTKIFRTMHRKTTKVMAAALGLPHGHLAKAEPDADATLREVMDSLAAEWETIARLAKKPLTDAALAGASKGALELEISAEDMLTGINETARKWASNRAAELVGMRLTPEGKFIVNPNPKWAISDTTRDKLRSVITDVFGQEGKITLRDVENRIEQSGVFSDVRASTIARNEIARAQTQGNLKSWRESGLVQKVSWELSEDHDKDDICNELEGQYDINDVPDLPAHVNCCLPGTVVTACGGIAAQLSRRYKGKAIVIGTETGEHLAVTPNHPVLTGRGLVGAGVLRKGDYVFRSGTPRLAALIIDPDHDNVPTVIEEIGRALLEAGGVSTGGMPISAEDFHGDGIVDGEVNIVWSADFLELDRASRKKRGHFSLVARDMAHGIGFPASRPAAQVGEGPLAATDSSVGSRSHRAAPLGTATAVEDELHFSESSDSEPVTLKQLANRETVTAKSFGDIDRRLAGLISAVEVVDISEIDFEGHVGNLQTGTGFYFTDGILTHNCLCSIVLAEPSDEGAE